MALLGCDAQVLFMICTLTLWLWLDIVETRPIVPFRKDTHAVNPWVSTESSYRSHFKDHEVLHRLKASAEQHLRVFALEIVEGSDGAEEDVSLQLEYQRSQETSISRCQEEHRLNFRGNRGGSDSDEGEGEEEEGRNGGRGNGSGRRSGGGGGGGGGDGDGEGGDVEGRGGDKKKLSPTLKILQLIAMSTIANTTQTFGSAISLKVGGLTFLTKILLILVTAISLAGYLCSIIAILLMPKRPRFSRVLVWTGCAATSLGFLILIVALVLEL
ncbi:uncharacterized protein LOC142633146 [Castanea sativa]|uniref:uncharacterized protein LOC142633146 n=1 Tax=Castanea sativa TaxID=21020 RepID=UPI003F64B1F3